MKGYRKIVIALSVFAVLLLSATIVCLQHPNVVRSVVGRVIPVKTVRYEGESPNYSTLFNDLQNRQIVAAKKYGLKIVPKNREELDGMMEELVPVCNSQNVTLGYMPHSAKLLRPNALEELETIGEKFRKSLEEKGLPKYRIIVTSLLRTQEDVVNLRAVNSIATANSCHSYGTTYDISYASFDRISLTRKTPSEDLKKILSEVLKEERQTGNIYVKHEVSQSCFHITCRK